MLAVKEFSTVPEITTDVEIQDKRWLSWRASVEADVQATVAFVLEEQGDKEDYEVSVLLTDDEEIQSLNNQYRGKDKPTNVLSFPQDEVIDGTVLLGDVVVAYETVLKEAKEQHKSEYDHFRHMLVHSVLHLLGFDHESEDEANEMESLEVSLLARLNISNPYEGMVNV